MRFKQLIVFRRYSTMKSTFYATTPIYYVNSVPHLGHLYSSLIADAVQRWQSITNCGDIKFATGTDEHGTKIQQAAGKSNIPLKDYCRNIADKYKLMAGAFNIQFTDFIRTTNEDHALAVKKLWHTLDESGYIYSSKYRGWYCVSDETFLTDSQLKEVIRPDGQKVTVALESGHPAEWTEEDNYMFRLGSLQQDLIYWLSNNDVVKPKKFQKILLDMIGNEELPDVSISRPASRVFWGIEVPEDDTQTIYVWLDALVNYLTVAGYPEVKSKKFQETWPPDVQVIGKDILKFHGIYWPAFLLAAKLDLPKCIVCHSHWTVDNEKMSKSKNNVVCPMERSQIYTTDGLRYFLLREGVAHSDGNYSDTKVIRILNSELADTLGNLLSRCCSVALNPNQVFPEIDFEAFQSVASLDVTKKLIESVIELPDICHQHYSDYNFYKAVDATISTLHAANLFFETLKPWELKKRDTVRLNVVLHITMETLRICAVILQPIIPNISESILNKLSVSRDERLWNRTKNQSWNNNKYKTKSLSIDKALVFKRLFVEEETKKKGRN